MKLLVIKKYLISTVEHFKAAKLSFTNMSQTICEEN